jgi:mannose-6-phosphate isomerase-like protein (cupin superfamily)
MHRNINSENGKQKDESLRIIGLLSGDNFNFDVAGAELHGHHAALVNTGSDRAYIFLDGTAQVRVGSEIHSVERGSVVSVPKGSEHELLGNCTYFIVTSPPRRDGDEHLAQSVLPLDV